MTDSNPDQDKTQIIDLSDMIDRYSFDSQHRGPNQYPVNVGFSHLSYINNHQKNYFTEGHQQTKIDKRRQQKCTSLLF